MEATATQSRAVWSGTGFFLGAGALLLAVIQFWAGPFAPQPETAVSLGELSAEVGKSMLRSWVGIDPPPPEPLPWDIDRILQTVAAGLGALAIVLALVGFVRRENWRYAVGAAALGGSAILFQLFIWVVVVIAFVLIVGAIMSFWTELIPW